MSHTEFCPLFMEEVFLVNLYGTEEEAARLNRLLEREPTPEVTEELVFLIEEIKRRHVTRADWFCANRTEPLVVKGVAFAKGTRTPLRHIHPFGSASTPPSPPESTPRPGNGGAPGNGGGASGIRVTAEVDTCCHGGCPNCPG